MQFLADLPWPEPWAHFATWRDGVFALVGLLLILLLIIWWRQQTRVWYRIVLAALLAGLVMTIGSSFLFVVPPYRLGCETGCTGWAGYPLPVTLITLDGARYTAPLDFLLNLLMLWLLWLGASLLWTILGIAFNWWNRSLRARLLFVLVVAVLPWAIMPRILNPPQPAAHGEELRLVNNARRSAEFTYRITGFWVQRLAAEDLRTLLPDPQLDPSPGVGAQITEVCLRGYTYFYLPWRRYRIQLDASGTTALNLVDLPLTGSCWEPAPDREIAPASPGISWRIQAPPPAVLPLFAHATCARHSVL